MWLHCLTKLNLYHWLAISLLLHVSLALPFLWTTLHIPDQHRQEKLGIELYGMISNRQMEEQHKGDEVPQQTQKTVQPVNNALNRPINRPTPDKYQAESPVQVEKTDDTSNQSQQASVAMPVSSAGAAVEQRQQMNDYKAINEYANKVIKRVRANLVYPKEVKENGLTGTTTIAFTITLSGNIKEGTLRVIKSSGYAALDASALRAAQSSAPFEEPPGEQDAAVPVDFDHDI